MVGCRGLGERGKAWLCSSSTLVEGGALGIRRALWCMKERMVELGTKCDKCG